MSLADELLADLEDENDDGELEELIKIKVESDEEGKIDNFSNCELSLKTFF